MNKPLVSIIIPVFNREEVLAETLDSVLMQSYLNWECIIVDDGSTDNSPLVIKDYCRKDPRFKFFNRPDVKIKGASSCRNYGFEQSHGQLIQYLDSDDILDSDKLYAQLKMFSVAEDLTLFTCRWGWFRNTNRINDRFKTYYEVYKNYKNGAKLLSDFGYYNSFFPPHVYLIGRKLIYMAGEWDENLTNNDDAEFFTRVILNSNKVIFINNAKVYYRFLNKDKLSEVNSEKKALSAIRSWEMINSHINLKTRKSYGAYVKNALFNLHEILIKEFPELVFKHKSLFEKRKKFDSTYYRIVKKIKSN